MADPSLLGLWEACWRDLVLGIVQGLTEFCPSAARHTESGSGAAGLGRPRRVRNGAIQLGSIFAVIAYFRS